MKKLSFTLSYLAILLLPGYSVAQISDERVLTEVNIDHQCEAALMDAQDEPLHGDRKRKFFLAFNICQQENVDVNQALGSLKRNTDADLAGASEKLKTLH
ncbi:hypothetical protein ACFSJ3_10025 [Corallincola platygyrae]|uniref:Uncharacterized protein n=1 Tax=Corallincola platygyrae TaxID=1193278 RepID=A0ABW4XMR0_9GAMM